jgi:mannose-6-phosphate isomerase-like protein (cupin superfamily)
MFKFFKKKEIAESDESKLADGALVKSWGTVQTVFEDVDAGFEFRKITINPLQETSFHRHLKRREYWLVASGIGTVEVADNPQWGRQTYVITAGKEAVMAMGRWHRLKNTSTDKQLTIYEVAIGDVSEEDSERLKE